MYFMLTACGRPQGAYVDRGESKIRYFCGCLKWMAPDSAKCLFKDGKTTKLTKKPAKQTIIGQCLKTIFAYLNAFHITRIKNINAISTNDFINSHAILFGYLVSLL